MYIRLLKSRSDTPGVIIRTSSQFVTGLAWRCTSVLRGVDYPSGWETPAFNDPWWPAAVVRSRKAEWENNDLQLAQLITAAVHDHNDGDISVFCRGWIDRYM